MPCRAGRATCCATWPSTRSTRKTLAVAACKASTACASWSTPKARWCRTRWPVGRAAPRWTGRPWK
jgi:hypothetical protein